MKTYKITLFGVKETTKLIAEHLYHSGVKVDLIISIDKAISKKNAISDYLDLKMTAEIIGAEYYQVKDYSLNQGDEDFFQNNQFELGIVYGWQRIIPQKIMVKFNQGLFGFHASPDRLPKGRGRSPLNWGIILGKTVLYNHFFRYVSEADAGDIYSVTKFAITPHDTILTLLYKSLLIAKKEVVRLVEDINSGKVKLTSQHGTPYFFPARKPEDGLIHFETSKTKDIVNLIRGVTKPFPGAFCFTSQGEKIIIWDAWEFDALIDFSRYQLGEVIDNLYNMPVIKTKDGSIILKNYEGRTLLPHDQLGADNPD